MMGGIATRSPAITTSPEPNPAPPPLRTPSQDANDLPADGVARVGACDDGASNNNDLLLHLLRRCVAALHHPVV